ncbi:unnamed protein product, partial [Didymodactylos carnosus]
MLTQLQTLSNRNQVGRECLYAWYPEVIDRNQPAPDAREIYINNGINKDLIRNGNECINRYEQSITPSEQIYRSAETINEALTTPWALHYEVKRRPASPNIASNEKYSEMSTLVEQPRRLKSAPLLRGMPPTPILNIPQPRNLGVFRQLHEQNQDIKPPRSSSAKARLNTSTNSNQDTTHKEQTTIPRQTQSAHVSRSQSLKHRNNGKLSDNEIQMLFTKVYGKPASQPTPPPCTDQVIITQIEPSSPTPQPIYAYTKANSWCGELPKDNEDDKDIERKSVVSEIPLNPYYIHRPGVIAIPNADKKPVVFVTNSNDNKNIKRRFKMRKSKKHDSKRHLLNEPLLALTPMYDGNYSNIEPRKADYTNNTFSVEAGGVKLIYDPNISLEDPSPQLTKYLVNGRLYLIKNQRYNFIDNVDTKELEKYNENLKLHERPKYYQTIPIEKFKPTTAPPELHYNASETYFYNTVPKQSQRYVVSPNWISEDL